MSSGFLFVCQVLHRPKSLHHALGRAGVHPLFDRNVLRLLHQHISPTAQLRAWAQSLPAPLNDLDKFLKRHQGVLTGSTTLHCFLGDNKDWSPNNIDIFFASTSRPLAYHFPDWELKSEYHIAHTSMTVYQYFHYQSQTILNCNVYTGSKLTPCQTQNHVKAMIHHYFDLDGCTIAWDGTQWSLSNRISWTDFYRKRFRLADPFTLALTDKKATRFRKRVALYLRRGFFILNLEAVEQCMNGDMDSMSTAIGSFE